MGLLDNVLKQIGAQPGVAIGEGQSASTIFSGLSQLLSGQGGLAGLRDLFQQKGLGDLISSWIGTGANLPVSADQLKQVLGGERLSQMAAQLGIPAGEAATKLSEVLPTLIDKATPDGTIPAGGDLLGKAFGVLKK